MKNKMQYFRLGLLVPAFAALLISSTPLRADFIFSLDPVITAQAGSTGNVFDVLLKNLGASTVTVGSFSFGITTANTDITFTNADTSTTAPYIFAGDSFDDMNGFTLYTNSLPGQTVEAADASASLVGASVGAGVTVGVGRIMFDIANGATPGPFAVTFEASPTTGLSDTNGNGLDFTTTDGTITITPATNPVPEPAQATLLFCAFAGIVLLSKRRRP
ncbi:MAG TPA: hypothetical protein VKT81_28040 [Bryobacteraceae bacterium]|nr:hypothetical protein [Bryobacteraceae bacterium]